MQADTRAVGITSAAFLVRFNIEAISFFCLITMRRKLLDFNVKSLDQQGVVTTADQYTVKDLDYEIMLDKMYRWCNNKK